MKQIIFLLSSFLILASIGCTGTGYIAKDNNPPREFNRVDNPDMTVSLADHLRKVAGVQVTGSGSNARVLIRGINSINSGTEPLFVVNGNTLDGGLRAAMDVIPVNSIKSIVVLKNPAETGIYGVRGANGVIEITLKN